MVVQLRTVKSLIIYILRFTHSFLHEKFRLINCDKSSEMAFSHVRKAFRPIRRHLSKHPTDFIQQVQVQYSEDFRRKKTFLPKEQKYL